MKITESYSNELKTLWEKGEIARYEQFLLFPHSVFKRLALSTRKYQGLFGKRVKSPLPIKICLFFLCVDLLLAIGSKTRLVRSI